MVESLLPILDESEFEEEESSDSDPSAIAMEEVIMVPADQPPVRCRYRGLGIPVWGGLQLHPGWQTR